MMGRANMRSQLATRGTDIDHQCGHQAREPARMSSLVSSVVASPIVVMVAGVLVQHVVSTTMSADSITTTHTTINAHSVCSAVVKCLGNDNCSRCLKAINETVPHTIQHYEAVGGEDTDTPNTWMPAYLVMMATPSCSSDATPPAMMLAALNSLDTDSAAICATDYGMMIPNGCIADGLYPCFADANCQRCFNAVINHSDGANGGTSKLDVIMSPTCTNVDANGISMLEYIANTCHINMCTLNKYLCSINSVCAPSLEALRAGDVARSVQLYKRMNWEDAGRMSMLVSGCLQRTELACAYAKQMCAEYGQCGACLAGMNNDVDVHRVVAPFSSSSCRDTVTNGNALGSLAQVSSICPGISACRSAVTESIYKHGDKALSCIDGSIVPIDPAFCTSESMLKYDIESSCQPCSWSVHLNNYIVFATAIVGGVSVVACLVVVATIFAHERDKSSTRDRIIVGLMLANAVYSSANVIPLNALLTGNAMCGQLAASFDTIRYGRAWWFGGKYGIVGYEWFMLVASIRALMSGASALPRWAERAFHVACWAAAAAAFLYFYFACKAINAAGYNNNAETHAVTDSVNHMSASDDADDYGSVDASQQFDAGRQSYDNLVRTMLVVWDIAVAVAVVLWIVLRLILYRYALQQLRTQTAALEQAQLDDEWEATRRSAWAFHHRVLQARREAFVQVAKPLEPYIGVFVLFAVPAVIMSTTYCQSHSGAKISTNHAQLSSDYVSYGYCDVACEFVLAFRSVATVCVYLVSRERRIEVIAVRRTWRKLLTRATSWLHGLSGSSRTTPYVLLSNDDQVHELAHMPSIIPPNGDTHASDVNANTPSYESLHERDITKVRRIGVGGFADVWEGVLNPHGHAVAIKVLFATSTVDEDGSQLDDTEAERDFLKECSALQRVNSPHLIRLFGFGITNDGHRFLVTELMTGGSLESILHNSHRDLPWRTRHSIGLQVALGMSHLHSLQLLHRDLKSANVLLDENRNAKVCDFGLSRTTGSVHQYMVSLPFVGVKRRLSAASGIHICDPLHLAGSHAASAWVDPTADGARDMMTKAAGTFLWMSPEVFRGDRTYGFAVDVFSFGMLLWELVTRKTPWSELMSCGDANFFTELNLALQTGRRPHVPEDVAEQFPEFIAVMKRCWTGDPADRPSFEAVVADLAGALRSV